MTRRAELTGQRFGELVVLRLALTRGGRAFWTCRCRCGAERAICGNTLTCGRAVTCGCKGLPWTFWERVQRGGDCWPWTGGTDKDGYGTLSHHGRTTRAHRVAWELTHGPIADGLHVLHRCDNRPCCNPSHLFLGTNADNVADMVAKGRQLTVGKITEAQAEEIRRRYAAEDISQKALGADYGLSNEAVSDIVRGATWRR